MKLNIALLFWFFCVFVSDSFAQTTDFKRYKIKSAIIEYELSGLQNGAAITYFDNYGMQEATYEKATVDLFGELQEVNSISYLDGYWQYNLDLIANKGTKTKNTILESLVEGTDGDLETIGREMFLSMGGVLTGKEELLGKQCEVWELSSMGTKVWVWKNIPLKSETNMMGITITRTATSLEVGATILPEKLSIPEEVEFQEINMNSLKEVPGQSDPE